MSQLNELADLLESRASEIAGFPVVAGFDGFVDEMIKVVEERQGLDSYTPIADMARFAEVIGQAAGRSSLREIVVDSMDAGGCAVNLGDGIATFGVQLDYFGTLGAPRHAAFDGFADKCRSCTSWGKEPGRTLALEFQDGKYMLSAVAQLQDFNEALLDEVLADGSFAAACEQARLIALTNWTLYPHMTACWTKLQREVFDKLTHKPWLFVDLVDPRSRSEDDIRAMLDVLPGYETGCRTVFGGNLNEANVIAGLLGLDTVEEGEAVPEQAAAIRSKLGISQVATHCLKGAGAAAAATQAWAEGPFTPRPKKSTGAGDRFNAGYCLGLLLDLELDDCLRLGNGSSGYFVRQATSGDCAAVAAFLRRWAEGKHDA